MSKSILIIDDSILLHELIKTYLEPDGLTFHSAYDREAGLAAAARVRPALILLDIDMPGIDGFEFCRRLKADPLTAAVPIIFLTAHSQSTDRSKGLDVGAFDYVAKPFEPRELRVRVRGALRSRNRLEAGKLVDPTTGLWNRTYLDAHVEYHLSLAKRLSTALSCILVEVEESARLMETFGETFVSDLLRGLGRILTGGCRADDVVCRFDQWKFAILATNANQAAATLVAWRLRNEVERQLRFRSGQETRITCSVGVADAFSADAGALVETAEAALNAARLDRASRVPGPADETAVI